MDEARGKMNQLQLGALTLELGRKGELFSVRTSGSRSYSVRTPAFEIDGELVGGFAFAGCEGPRELSHGGQEWRLRYECGMRSAKRGLEVVIRAFAGSPLIRFRYRLTSDGMVRLTKSSGKDSIRYFTVSGWGKAELTRIQLGHFNPMVHSYNPGMETYKPSEQYDGQTFAGPIAIMHDEKESLLLAYEHGQDHPDSFLAYTLECGMRIADCGMGERHDAETRRHGDAATSISVSSTNGNYYDGYPIGVHPRSSAADAVDSAFRNPHSAFESVWFELGIVLGSVDELLPRYRRFVLEEMAENRESRRPYVYYNTWNYQERNHHYNGRPFLESMNLEHTLAEIEVAHRLGIDVFVIDTGWYNKTGDWLVNLERFPDGLQEVRRRLEGYGMKLGLWFNPIVAAKTSEIYTEHPGYVISMDGKPWYWGQIWETEESYGMCLASGYSDHFARTMIRLRDELGVTYFKWDGIHQYGCDSPDHDHGTSANSPEERRACYAYEMGRRMVKIVEDVTRERPDVIVDFDVTEGGRFMGLGFLSAGKFFLVNNGPYWGDFDIDRSLVNIQPDVNVFFHPGAARPRICRQGAKYDSVIPSILFLTHYLPDPPARAQMNSLASLMLGGNGIWGDLLALSEDDIALISEHIASYKQVADAVTRAYPRCTGFPGSSPEIYEKLDPETGSGIVVFFTFTPGSFEYVTRPLAVAPGSVKGVDSWEVLPDGRLRMKVTLGQNGAAVVYVGAE